MISLAIRSFMALVASVPIAVPCAVDQDEVDPVRRDAGGGAAAEGCYRGGRGHAERMPRRERLLVIIASASGDQ